MKKNLKQFLEELYQLDPSLQAKEEQLLKILDEMLTNRPNAHFDEAFKAELHRKIRAEISLEKGHIRTTHWKNTLIGFFAGAGGVAFAAFAVFQFVNPPAVINTSTVSPQAISTTALAEVDFGFKAEQKPNQAFGAIRFSDQPTSKDAKGLEAGKSSGGGMRYTAVAPTAAPAATSRPSGAPEATSVTPATEPATLKMSSTDSRIAMPPYEMKTYKYIYSGSGLVIKDSEMSVYQKQKNTLTSAEAQSLLSNFKVSSIDLSKFSDLLVNSIDLAENKQFGHTINMNFGEGTMFISKNWTKWPQINCQDDACYKANQTKLADVPSDDASLAIAAKFLKDYKLDVSAYGKPFVNNDWKKQYEAATDKSTAYVPDAVTVMYPLVIDGKTVYEEYGQAKGMTLTIDIKSGIVSDVSGIEKLNFASSKYSVETDFKKILEVASKGGRNGFSFPYPIASTDDTTKVTTIDVKLGEPTMSFTHIYEYKDGESNEYIVPALIFPVTQTPKEGEYFSDKIIVPIVKDFFESKNPPIMYKEAIAQ